ncbi:uncharacterized protein LOC131949072 [Physella acuta]|uniref:uncharacterized protein LOC131949072 n=1 Tax=Physella acuta TaxID=109671 RepID=UPI0027DB37EE|nr:uncharacterized protein LOC131949072 [Physella acuta]
MEIMFLLTVILTTLTQHCTVVHAGGTFSSYFILGVPRYSSATAEFYLVTMSDVPFYVTCRIKEPRTLYTEEKIYLTEFYLTRYKVFVKSLGLENNPNYRSIVFENPKYENDFAVTMMIIDKRTGNWIDSMLALPATSFYTEFYVPWFGIRALQAIVMSSAHGNLVELYYFNRDTNVYYSEDFIFVNYEEFADFSRIMCDTDYYLGGVR